MTVKKLSNYWRTLEMSLINCEINLILSWSVNCLIIDSVGVGTCAITNAKLYISVVTLSTEDKAKLLKQLDSGFRRITTWCKSLIKVTTPTQD